MRYIKNAIIILVLLSGAFSCASASDIELIEEGREMPKLILSVGEKVWTATLYDNVATRDLLKMLPLTMTFKDYNQTEKVSPLSKRLSTEGLPNGFKPSVNDIAFYAPFGNLVIYYRDFSYSSGLFPIGRIDFGAEEFEKMRGDFTMILKVSK